MKKLLAPLTLALALMITACSGGTGETSATTSASSPSGPSADVSGIPGSDVEAIETKASASETYAHDILSDEGLAAMPVYLQDIYNQCMVDESQRSFEEYASEYNEALSSSYCQVVVEMNEGLEGVSQDQINELMKCLDHMETARPELFEGYSSGLEALEQQELKEACWDYMGM